MKKLLEQRDKLHVWLTTHKEPDANTNRGYWQEYWHNHGELEGIEKALAAIPPAEVTTKKGGRW